MEFRQLGRSGIRVTPLCLGMMMFQTSNEGEGIATVHEALGAGINFIDTANVYSRGLSEEVTGKALAGRRDEVILATKVHGAMGDGPNDHGNNRRHLALQCEASLRRLNTDYIDLYQLHRPDPSTPMEETLMAMDDLVRAGKVRYCGISTYPAWQIVEAMWLADRRHLASAPVCEQPPYNLLERRIERDVIPVAQKYGIGLIPWSPLAGGLLTGKYSEGELPEGSRYSARLAQGGADAESLRKALEVSQQLAGIAAEAGLTSTQLALAWCMQQPGVTSPIIGPRDRAQLRDNLAALEIRLDASTLEAIDRVAPPGEAVQPLF